MYRTFPEIVELGVGVITLTPLVGEVIATSIVPVVGVGGGVGVVRTEVRGVFWSPELRLAHPQLFHALTITL